MIEWLKTNQRWALIGGLLMWAVMFAAGRWSAPAKVEIKTVTVEVEKIHIDSDTVSTEVTKPDGTKTVTTHIVSKTDTVKDTKTKESKVVESQVAKTNLSFLGGLDITGSKFIKGVSVTRTVIGPISVGAWALSNKTVGMSVGVQF